MAACSVCEQPIRNSMCCCAQGCGSNPMADPGVWPACHCWCHHLDCEDLAERAGAHSPARSAQNQEPSTNEATAMVGFR